MTVLVDSGGAPIAVDKSVSRPVKGGGKRHQHHTQVLGAAVEFAEGAKEVLIINKNAGQSLFVNGTEVASGAQDGQYYQEVKDYDLDGLPTLEVTGAALSYEAIITY